MEEISKYRMKIQRTTLKMLMEPNQQTKRKYQNQLNKQMNTLNSMTKNGESKI